MRFKVLEKILGASKTCKRASEWGSETFQRVLNNFLEVSGGITGVLASRGFRAVSGGFIRFHISIRKLKGEFQRRFNAF